MAIIQATCPHCETQNNAFSIVHARAWPVSPRNLQSAGAHAMMRRVSASSYCSVCNKPVGFVLVGSAISALFGEFEKAVTNLSMSQRGIDADGFTLEETFPDKTPYRLPAHLPKHVVRSFEQGEQNYRLQNPDAAVAMYAKALEAGLRWRYPDIKGMLNEMIGTLLTKELLPPEIGDWAHQVRLLRKDAVHDKGELDQADMDDARNFADAVLRYTITFPTDVASRRGRPAESIIAGWKPPEADE